MPEPSTPFAPGTVLAGRYEVRRELGRGGMGVVYLCRDRFSGDSVALKRCKAFFPTIKQGLHYKFDSEVDVPATVAWGTKDKVLLYRQASVAASRLPNATHVDLPGAGHVPMTDDPELIVRHVEETIAKARAAEAAA